METARFSAIGRLSTLAAKPFRYNPVTLDLLLGHQPSPLCAGREHLPARATSRRSARGVGGVGEAFDTAAGDGERSQTEASAHRLALRAASATQAKERAAAVSGSRRFRSGCAKSRLALMSNGHFDDAEALRLLMRDSRRRNRQAHASCAVEQGAFRRRRGASVREELSRRRNRQAHAKRLHVAGPTPCCRRRRLTPAA